MPTCERAQPTPARCAVTMQVNHPGFDAHLFIGKVAVMPWKYDERTRAKAVRLVTEHRGDYASE